MEDSAIDALVGATTVRCGKKPGQVVAVPTDRLPPHSLEAEKGVLGCIIMAANECMTICVGTAGGIDEAFYDLRHGAIYETMLEMWDQRQAIDLLTLNDRLKSKALLDVIGGTTYLMSLTEAVPSSANLPYYISILMDKRRIRRLIVSCTDAVGKLYGDVGYGKLDELVAGIENDVVGAGRAGATKTQATMRELVQGAIVRIEAYSQNQGKLAGLGTGLADFDKMTGGLMNSEMIIIAGRPSTGKTTLMLNMADNIAVDLNLPVGIFSLEMSAESLVMRMICSRARVNMRNVTDGFLVERDFPKITNAAGRLASAPIWIDDTAALPIMELKARAKRLKELYDIRILFIDYLQLVTTTGSRRSENRQQEVSSISGQIKAIAKDLGIPVVVLSQLNRESEKDKKRKPRMSDLRESGSLENDGDLIAMLYTPSSEGDDADDGGADTAGSPVNLLIAKQRNGPTGEISLVFLKEYTRFEGVARISNEDVPSQPTRQQANMPYSNDD